MKLHELESKISELMAEFEKESGLAICEGVFIRGITHINKDYQMGVVIKSKGRVDPPMVRLRLDSGRA